MRKSSLKLTPYWIGVTRPPAKESKALIIAAAVTGISAVYVTYKTDFVASRWWEAIDHQVAIVIAALLFFVLLFAQATNRLQSGRQFFAYLLLIWTVAPLISTHSAPAALTWIFGSEYREDLRMRKVVKKYGRTGCSRIEGWVAYDGASLMPGTGATVEFCVGPSYVRSAPRTRWYRLTGKSSAFGIYFTNYEELAGTPIFLRKGLASMTFRRSPRPSAVAPPNEEHDRNQGFPSSQSTDIQP